MKDDALATVEQIMVRRIKFHQEMKQLANTGQGKRREHYRMHALSEAFGEIKKNTSALPAVTVEEPTEAQIASACLSYDHSFGLMDGPERVALMHQAREWFHAWRKEYVK